MTHCEPPQAQSGRTFLHFWTHVLLQKPCKDISPGSRIIDVISSNERESNSLPFILHDLQRISWILVFYVSSKWMKLWDLPNSSIHTLPKVFHPKISRLNLWKSHIWGRDTWCFVIPLESMLFIAAYPTGLTQNPWLKKIATERRCLKRSSGKKCNCKSVQLMFKTNLKLFANLAIQNLIPQLCISGLTCNQARDGRFTVIGHVNVGIRGSLPAAHGIWLKAQPKCIRVQSSRNMLFDGNKIADLSTSTKIFPLSTMYNLTRNPPNRVLDKHWLLTLTSGKTKHRNQQS